MSSEIRDSLISLRKRRIDIIHELNLIEKSVTSLEQILKLEPSIKKNNLLIKPNEDSRRIHIHRPANIKIDACVFTPCSRPFMARRKDAKSCCLDHDKFQYYEKTPHKRPSDWKGDSPYAWKNMLDSMIKSGIDADKADAYMKKHAGLASKALADSVKHEAIVRTHSKHKGAILIPGDGLSAKK